MDKKKNRQIQRLRKALDILRLIQRSEVCVASIESHDAPKKSRVAEAVYLLQADMSWRMTKDNKKI